jgi:phosphoglycerate dehydrogenase-like enzyme
VPVVLISSIRVKETGDIATESLRKLGCELRFDQFWPARPEAELLEAIKDVDAVVAGVEPYSANVIAAARRLKVISRTGVGYDAIDVDAANEHGVAVCIAQGSNDQSVADFAMTLMLALSRDLFAGHARVRSGPWGQPLAHDFYGSTVGIIGLGNIGKRLTRRLQGFDCKVLAYDVYHDEAYAAANGVRYVELDELLRESDFVSLHTLLLPSTRGMIGERELRLMKPTAYILNTARGPLIQAEPLHRALKERWIAGAGIDVFETEPPTGNPLLDPSLENIILGPHMAGVTKESGERMAIMACETVAHFLGGDTPLIGCVNREVLAL